MSINLRTKLEQVRDFVSLFASATETKLDDLAIEAINFVLGNAILLDWLQSLIDQRHPVLMSGDAGGLLAAAPAAVSAEVGKIGDGKILEFLMKILPLILKFI